MDPIVSVNFICQTCHQPINLDPGFATINELTLAELTLPIYPGGSLEFDESSVDKIVPAFHEQSVGQAHGFTLVGDTFENEKSQPIKVVSELFDLLASNSDIDHPLCAECTDTMLEMLDKSNLNLQKDLFKLSELVHGCSQTQDDETAILEEELKRLLEEEKRLLNELLDVDREQAETNAVLEHYKEEKKGLDEEDENYWRCFCNYKAKLIVRGAERKSYKNRLTCAQNQLHNLQQKNVFNTTFHIWHSSHFGTINYLRLGNLPSVPVSWPEICAAWGQTILLLSSLARKVDLTFTNYKLVPYGNVSYIEVLQDGSRLPLFESSGLRYLWNNNFDNGMVAFLECMAEFQDFVESKGLQGPRKTFSLPYKVSGNVITDVNANHSYSIKLQFNPEDVWTKALKFLLTNLKWGLTWVSSDLFLKALEAGNN